MNKPSMMPSFGFVAERFRTPWRLIGQAAGAIARGYDHLRRYRFIKLIFILILFSPTIVAAFYFGLIASKRYVSEAQFIVRTASKPAGASGFAAILQMTGFSVAQDELYSSQAVINSRDAITRIGNGQVMREIYSRPEADSVAKFPSIFYSDTNEELYQYMKWMMETVHNTTTGITTLRVYAFRAEDAKHLAQELLGLAEETVNELNTRIRRDSLKYAIHQVEESEKELIEAQIAITQFRNRELMIDPASSSIISTELVARLGASLAQVEAQIRELGGSPGSPQRAPLERQADALRQQILQERQSIANDKTGLADKLAAYEHLVLRHEFTKQKLSGANTSLEAARQEAQRQQVYLERIVDPIAPDYPMSPSGLRIVMSTLALNVFGILVLWLMITGVREHAARH